MLLLFADTIGNERTYKVMSLYSETPNDYFLVKVTSSESRECLYLHLCCILMYIVRVHVVGGRRDGVDAGVGLLADTRGQDSDVPARRGLHACVLREPHDRHVQPTDAHDAVADGVIAPLSVFIRAMCELHNFEMNRQLKSIYLERVQYLSICSRTIYFITL